MKRSILIAALVLPFATTAFAGTPILNCDINSPAGMVASTVSSVGDPAHHDFTSSSETKWQWIYKAEGSQDMAAVIMTIDKRSLRGSFVMQNSSGDVRQYRVYCPRNLNSYPKEN